MIDVGYILPFRAAGDENVEELASYLKMLANHVAELIVVDGSDAEAWDAHDLLWGSFCKHVRPRDDLHFANGKVDGVITGVEMSSLSKVVIADDDVRYEPESLARVASLLEEADLVIPQNFFSERPWHALWDTGRTLLNRAFSWDYPGTLGFRRDIFLAAGGYDGDVMFENLELIRTIQAAGGQVVAPLDLLVERQPPEAGRFFSQRIRQAYDEFALPARLVLFLSVMPAVGTLVLTGRKRWLPVIFGTTVAIAERGRRQPGGRRVYPAMASFMAPFWLLERGLCMWLAVGELLKGGIGYRGRRIRAAAHSRKAIASRLPYPWTRGSQP